MSLPKLTMKLKKMMDAPNSASSDEQRLKLQYAFLAETYPKEQLAELLDGTSLDSVDIAALEKVYAETVDEYEAPIREARMKRVQQVGEMLEQLDLSKLDKLMNRQGFRNVL